MKISKRGKKRQKKLTFIKKLTTEEISVKYAADIERARAYLEKMRPVYQLASKKWNHLFDDSTIQGGVLAGPLHKHKK